MNLTGGKRGGRKIVEDRLTKTERRIEIWEREERRRNIIIKGVEVKKGKRREAVEEVLRVKAEMEKSRKLGGEKGKEGERCCW